MLTTGCPHFLRPVVVDGGRVVWGCGGGAGGGGGGARSWPCGAEEEEEDLFVFNDTIEGPRAAQRSCWRWPPSPCRGVAPCGLLLVAGGGWLVLLRDCDACNRRPPSSTSASTSGLSRPVRRVVGWVGFLSDVIGGVERALWEGCYSALTLAHGVCVIVYV